ncbi:hypothetical protein [Bacillus thuringiensis]|uniref:hypothetical protein n=1 Tax=Bacillus thuringiensis TaxID=1428 RepID=UPI00159BB225|nr:hypothetical protein [Bacillus thuringiensis]
MMVKVKDLQKGDVIIWKGEKCKVRAVEPTIQNVLVSYNKPKGRDFDWMSKEDTIEKVN